MDVAERLKQAVEAAGTEEQARGEAWHAYHHTPFGSEGRIAFTAAIDAYWRAMPLAHPEVREDVREVR